jgi:hypothetical protein
MRMPAWPFGRERREEKRSVLVLLRRSPFALDRDAMEAVARHAWGHDFGRNRDGSPYVDSEEPGMFVLSPHGNAILVAGTLRGQRRMQLPRNLAESDCPDAWADYAADVSVGLTYVYERDWQRLRRYVGTLAAELIDDETLALYHIATHRLLSVDGDLRRRLRAGAAEVFGG